MISAVIVLPCDPSIDSKRVITSNSMLKYASWKEQAGTEIRARWPNT